MNPLADRNRRLVAFGPAGLVGLSLLVSACGGSSGIATGTSASAAESAQLAYASCMRSHGVPNFPDPDPQGNFPPFNTGVSKQTSAAADGACRNLLASSGGSGAGTRGAQQKLAFALTVARCVRSHGFRAYPDPTTSSQGTGTRFQGTGIDTKSPQFQTAEANCEKQARHALGLP